MVSFVQDILPLFTPIDIDHMRAYRPAVLLDDYGYMSQLDAAGTPVNANEVALQLSTKQMPPTFGGGGGPWPDDRIALFQSWIDDGLQP